MSTPAREVLDAPEVQESKGGGGGKKPPRHIVENNRDGTPQDAALCGYLWDRLNVEHNGEICQECVEEQKRRPRW